ncbi:class E sortase [Streptomyces sp. NBC_00102]|uniref:class E sortase n=1 Tax=Streptomyces sp. NBC_00102 TaxID=2975652 RepID=UPI00225899DB|nr:class E sortase [Streptomyces sp. NBC_00102]MCX5398312.1 class E sortase [Streptomyces sp. NBC_00102]
MRQPVRPQGHQNPQQAPYGPQEGLGPSAEPGEWYDPEGYRRDWYGQEPRTAAAGPSGPAGPTASGFATGNVPTADGGAPAPGPARASGRHASPAAGAAPGTQAPGTQAPGTQAPGTQAPGTQEPVAQPPFTQDSSTRAPRAQDLSAPSFPSAFPDEAATTVLPPLDLPERDHDRLPPHDETVALRTVGPVRAGGAPQDVPPPGGRAERRRAAKAGGRRKAPQAPVPPGGSGPGAASGGAGPARPMSRVEARRAARAAKDSPAVVVSRVVGELFISLGVLMLLFVAYQLWWTNVRADRIAGQETHKIQDQWAAGERDPGTFAPGQGFAIIHIPKLDVVAPIAEGTSKEKVLDRGMVGHYGEGALKTAMPSDAQGNFALAGHRNTHGEPFRYVNKLVPGDKVVVETQDAYYTYEMTKTLAQTSPSNVSVISPVPAGSGFTAPGRYITLTTCTPEFTSTYRLIVWGKMVDERPRSKGKPDALLD